MACRSLCAECVLSPIFDPSRGKCSVFGARETQEPACDRHILVSTVLAVAPPRQGKRPTRGASIRLSSTRGMYFIFLLPERTSVKEPTRNCHENVCEYSDVTRALALFARLCRRQSNRSKSKDFHMLREILWKFVWESGSGSFVSKTRVIRILHPIITPYTSYNNITMWKWAQGA